MRFELEAGGATAPRAGKLSLAHGVVRTPAFMPVATRGAVKAVDMEDLRGLGAEMILANAYHLWQGPGPLHRFTGWERPILTDSGGFQAVSLARVGRARVVEEGVVFRRDDGDEVTLTPELAIDVQERLAPDVMMVLDQPVRFPDDAREGTARTIRWGERSLRSRSKAGPALFGIVQGGFDPDLRREAARATRELGFPGYGIGGLSLNEPAHLTQELTVAVTAELEPDKPRYLMGVGSEPELLRAVKDGVDLFDCVWPTRLARTGTVLVGAGRLNLVSHDARVDQGPLEPGCECPTCRRHSRAGLRYMFQRGEALAHRLLTIHNLHHVLHLMREARGAIVEDRWAGFMEARLGPN